MRLVRPAGAVFALASVLAGAVALPAHAHLLKLFATVEDGAIAGFAFFVGGGRAGGAQVVVRDGADAEVARFSTNDDGRFRWVAPRAQTYTLTVDTGDGHVAEAVVAGERLGGGAGPVAGADIPPAAPRAVSDPAVLEAVVQRAVDRAVERQVRPLLEAYAQSENRVRFNDVMGGIGMIVGLAGVALWATTRRTSRGDGP